MNRDHGMSGEEQRLADLLKRTVPEPPRQLTYEEITVQHAGLLKKSWLVPALAAASILVIGGSIGAVAATRSGPSAAVVKPMSGQSSAASPTARPAPTCEPVPVPAFRVPGVVGARENRAVQTLTRLGLQVRVVTDGRSTAPRGTVIRQAPAAGKIVYRGLVVTLDVSASGGSGGLTPVPAPTSPVCAATPTTPVAVPTATASAWPVTPTATVPVAVPVPSSSVTPAPTTPVAVPTATAAVVPMPNVVGETQLQAEHVLQQIGVGAVIVHQAAGSGHVPAGTVWRQYPPAGSDVASGLTVTLYVQPAA